MLSNLRATGSVVLLTILTALAPAIVRLDPTLEGPFRSIELLPWVGLFAVVVAAICIPIARRRFDLSHPLLYVTLSYFGAFWIVGATIFAVSGVSHLWPALIRDWAFTTRLVLLYVTIAYAAFAAGFHAITAARAGERVSRRLPATEWSDRWMLATGFLLVACGLAAYVVSFISGTSGYQTSGSLRFVAIAYFLTRTLWFGQVVLWFAIFRAPRLTIPLAATAAVLVVSTPVWMVLSGGRGIVVSQWFLIVLVFFLARTRVTYRNLAVLGVIGLCCLGAGVLYGTTFRLLKAGFLTAPADSKSIATEAQAPVVASPTATASSSPAIAEAPAPVAAPPVAEKPPVAEPPAAPVVAAPPATATMSPEEKVRSAQRRVSVGEQVSLAADSVRIMGEHEALRFAGNHFAARLEPLGALSVVVSNRDRLTEQTPANLRWSIPIAIASSFIPRAIWRDKPVLDDARTFGRIYFQSEDNAFALTPMGDLVINFGPLSIPAGMALFGMLFRLLYGSLVEHVRTDAVRAAFYVVGIMGISFEGAYGTVLPILVRIFVVGVAFFAVPILIGRMSTRSSPAAVSRA